MMEWHARTRESGADTWHMGRFMQEWADPRAWQAYQATFAPFDPAACWHALSVSMDLFRWMSQETANALSIPYLGQMDQHVTQLVNDLRMGSYLTPPKE